MTPGPKKKSSYKKGNEDKQVDKKKESINSYIGSGCHQETNDIPSFKNSEDDNFDVPHGRKYNKRVVQSNWDRYDEETNDPFADKMRGTEFEDVLSCSGGTGSHLQLLDEKDWDENNVSDKHISIDFQNLTEALKCIPFHKRLDLPENIFDRNQILTFDAFAEQNEALYLSKTEQFIKHKNSAEPLQLVSQNSSLNLIESHESHDDITENRSTIPYVIQENTESIIESLASCLSFKKKVQCVENDAYNTDNIQNKTQKSSNAADDLDFLLSLSISSKSSSDCMKTDSVKSTNVDDWLNSILDD